MEYLTCGIFNAQRLEIEGSWKKNNVGLQYHVNEWYAYSLQTGEHFVNNSSSFSLNVDQIFKLWNLKWGTVEARKLKPLCARYKDMAKASSGGNFERFPKRWT